MKFQDSVVAGVALRCAFPIPLILVPLARLAARHPRRFAHDLRREAHP